jgi:hypothetical protein
MERNEILKKVNDVFIDVLEEEMSIKEEYSSMMLMDGIH